MNSALALQPITHAPIVPCETFRGLATLQPVADVRAYLKQRAETNSAVADWQDEEVLACRLPTKVKVEMKAMHRACTHVLDRVNGGASVQSACKAVLDNFKKDGWHWNLTTFRQKFDLWRARKDWLVLVNRARAGGEWIERDEDLPFEFLALCETRAGEFGRKDGMRQAIISLQRQWKTGRNHFDVEEPIAGYEVRDGTSWVDRDRQNLPSGWSEDNIRNQIKKRARFSKAVRALLHEGEAAARDFLPHVLTTKTDLRFMEQITFDDVRFDYLVLNEETGHAEELWALVARESSCRLVLGGVLYPATTREDGKASHLGAKQMKELAGFLLQTYPLPPYIVHWLVERGTATLREAVRMALAEMFEKRIKVSYTTMIGGRSATGYREKKTGNPRGKGSHESHNRLYQTQGSFIPGQTGAHYSIRPADLKARCDEAEQIWQDSRGLPEHLRSQVQYPLLTVRQARQFFNKFSLDQNFRTDHKIEGFDEVIEWWDSATNRWVVSDGNHSVGAEARRRLESPVERAAKKIREIEQAHGAGAWVRPSPEVVCTFLEHSQRRVKVNEKGRIQLDHEGRTLIFEHGGVPLKAQTKALAYHHEDDPEFLHLTDGDGCILGTWVQVGRIGLYDRDALARAMRGNHAALESARATAGELAAPRVADLEAMRRHNEELKRFITVTDAPKAVGEIGSTEIARSLAVAPAMKRKAKTREQQLKHFSGDSSELLD